MNLPGWPRRMKAPMAAAYLGISRTKFMRGVADKTYPQGVKDGGNTLWYLDDLNEYLDRGRGRRARSVNPDEALAGWHDHQNRS